MLPLQTCTEWAVTDDDPLQRLAAALHGAVGVHGNVQILLRRDASDVQHGDIVVSKSPLGPQQSAPARWRKQAAVHAVIKNTDIGKSGVLQLVTHVRTG